MKESFLGIRSSGDIKTFRGQKNLSSTYITKINARLVNVKSCLFEFSDITKIFLLHLAKNYDVSELAFSEILYNSPATYMIFQ